jgi:outer membrane immunogenic protein
MKNFIWGLVAGAMLGWCAQADAADLPLANKAPVAAVDYGDPWSGFYIGGAIGYGWNNGDGTGTGTTILGSGSTAFSTSPQGLVGGLHAGIGSHFGGNWYIGGEVAGGIGTLDGTAQNPGFIGNINSKTNALVSVSGRIGYILTPNMMVYARGGWAWANSEFSITGTDGSQFSIKPTVNGAMAGFGTEYALTRNWIAGLEYQHYFLSDMNMSTTGVILNTGLPVALSGKVDNHIDTVLGRLSYKF